MNYTVKDFLDWWHIDNESKQRTDWLEEANLDRNYYNNRIIREVEDEFVANTSKYPQMVNVLRGMVLNSEYIPTVENINEDLAPLEKLISSKLHYDFKMVKGDWYRRWIDHILIEGMGVVCVTVDPLDWDKYNPNGKMKIFNVNPRMVFLDTRARNLDEIRRLTVLHRMTRNEAERRFNKTLSNDPIIYESEFPNSLSYSDETEADRNEEIVTIAEVLWKESEVVYLNGRPKRQERWYGTYYYGNDLLTDIKPTLTGKCPYKISGAYLKENSVYPQGMAFMVRDLQLTESALVTTLVRKLMASQGYLDLINTAYLKDEKDVREVIDVLLSNNPYKVIAKEFTLNGQPVPIEAIHRRISPPVVDESNIRASEYIESTMTSQVGVQNVQRGVFYASDPATKAQLALEQANVQISSIMEAIRIAHKVLFQEMYYVNKRICTGTGYMKTLNRRERKFVVMNMVVPESILMQRKIDNDEIIYDTGMIDEVTGERLFVINPFGEGDMFIDCRVDSGSGVTKLQKEQLAMLLNDKGKISDVEMLSRLEDYRDDPQGYAEEVLQEQLQKVQSAQMFNQPAVGDIK